MDTSSTNNLKDLGVPGLESLVTTLGDPPFRVAQIGRWLYRNDVDSIEEMRNVPKTLRARLARQWVIERATVGGTQSSVDSSKKLLVQYADGSSVEAVSLPSDRRRTLCLSTQSGCDMGCRFCATARRTNATNLSIGQILEQFYLVVRPEPHGLGLPQPTHIVFMGMGEPLLNIANLIDVIRVLIWEHGPGYAARRITVSTCGIVNGIRRLADSGLRPRLALSLNAPWEDLRRDLMPHAPPLREIWPALRYYTTKTRQRVTLEYVLISGVNDSNAHASSLAKLSRTLPCKLNLILFNEFPECSYARPASHRVDAFMRTLLPAAPTVTLRQSMGTDIMAACGQLVGSVGPPCSDETREAKRLRSPTKSRRLRPPASVNQDEAQPLGKAT
jgi:23S rRNA (adenine2503-C2)-methyltransferase